MLFKEKALYRIVITKPVEVTVKDDNYTISKGTSGSVIKKFGKEWFFSSESIEGIDDSASEKPVHIMIPLKKIMGSYEVITSFEENAANVKE